MSNIIYIEWDEREAIKHALRTDEMSAHELAERIGMDPSKLSRIINREQKKLPIEELQKIAKGQGRPLSYYTDDVEVVVQRRNPEVVHSLNFNGVPLSGRTVCYGTNLTVRADGTTDWDQRPIEIYAEDDQIAA